METNIINNLTTRMMNCYDECKMTCSTFTMVNNFSYAHQTAKFYMNRAYGAMEFAVMLCHENGYPDMAGEIMNKWNDTWSVWFSDLIKEYED